MLDYSLSSETIKSLEGLLNGDRISLHKTSHRETIDIFEKLENLGLLTRERNRYTVNLKDRKHLKKLIELGSWKKFSVWLDTKEEDSSTTVTYFDLQGSAGIQVNQASGNGKIIKPKNETQESSKSSWLNKLFWILGILVSLTALYEFARKCII